MKKTIALALGLGMSLACVSAHAQINEKFPEKAVEFIVPWSAGGGYDVLIRALGAVFPKYANGQQLVIRNVPGGGAAIGTTEVMKAKPDGYTLGAHSTPIVTKIHWSNVPFDINSFEPVMMFADIPCYFLVPKDSPYKNLNDLMAAAKAAPGTVTMGNAGSGGGTHLVAMAFQKQTGVSFKNVPFEGGGPAVTALLGKHVDSAVGSSPEGIPNAQAGELRLLGVFADQRMAQFPDVPTAAEQGIPFYGTMWRGILAPKGTPREIVNRLDQIFKRSADDPEFVKLASEMGWPRKYMGPDVFKAFVESEDARWKDLIIGFKLGDRYKSQYK
jgi:tripartite-type tricarboxylate transporter receptor subunit TctC